ncbi:hypothetical protein PI27_gp118 [Listeria phage WIL-1]|nr:hypothetical protein PI27_gp118 [Listeria phage WIL-1]
MNTGYNTFLYALTSHHRLFKEDTYIFYINTR